MAGSETKEILIVAFGEYEFSNSKSMQRQISTNR